MHFSTTLIWRVFCHQSVRFHDLAKPANGQSRLPQLWSQIAWPAFLKLLCQSHIAVRLSPEYWPFWRHVVIFVAGCSERKRSSPSARVSLAASLHSRCARSFSRKIANLVFAPAVQRRILAPLRSACASENHQRWSYANYPW